MSRLGKSLALLLLFACVANAATTNNDDSCDIALLPAATLLLPYFEVDVAAPQSTITPGSRSLPNDANPNFAPTAAAECTLNGGPIPSSILQSVAGALTRGTVAGCGAANIGLVHALATGYATIDVVKSCGFALPNTPGYYDDLLYDNVLTGDYQSINPSQTTGNYAGGNPLVHIRAIPEGGAAGAVVATNLPFTFYDRYTPRAARCAGDGSPPAAARRVQRTLHRRRTDRVRFRVPHLARRGQRRRRRLSRLRRELWEIDEGRGSHPLRRARESDHEPAVPADSMSAEGRFSVMFDATMLTNGCAP